METRKLRRFFASASTKIVQIFPLVDGESEIDVTPEMGHRFRFSRETPWLWDDPKVTNYFKTERMCNYFYIFFLQVVEPERQRVEPECTADGTSWRQHTGHPQTAAQRGLRSGAGRRWVRVSTLVVEGVNSGWRWVGGDYMLTSAYKAPSNCCTERPSIRFQSLMSQGEYIGGGGWK